MLKIINSQILKQVWTIQDYELEILHSTLNEIKDKRKLYVKMKMLWMQTFVHHNDKNNTKLNEFRKLKFWSLRHDKKKRFIFGGAKWGDASEITVRILQECRLHSTDSGLENKIR